MQIKDIFLAILITMIWGINFSFIKLGLDTLDPFMITAIRFTLVAFPLVFFIKRPDVKFKYLVSYGFFFGVGVWGITTLGIFYGISAGIASLLIQMSVFFAILLGVILLNESINKTQILGFVISAIGITLIATVTDGSVSIIGFILVLIGAVFMAIVSLIVKKSNTKDMFSFLVWSSLFSIIPLFLLSYLTQGGEVFINFSTIIDTKAILAILFIVYPTTLFGYWAWNKLLQKYPISSVAPLALLVPFFGLAGSYIIFDEQLGLIKIIASIFIILGLIINIFGNKIIKGKSK